MEPASTTVAAHLLGATPPTVRRLLESGRLAGTRRPRGSTFVWVVDRASVDAFIQTEGRIDGKRRTAPSRLDRLEVEIGELRGRVDALEAPRGGAPKPASGDADLRAQIIDLQDALARTRAVLDLQRQADNERAAQVEHLLRAAAAGERAEALRRQAVEELDEALAGFTRLGHLGQVELGQR
ncbi:MAG: helix-turn-helix domain-containing protein [Acidimicrobiales bacterium]